MGQSCDALTGMIALVGLTAATVLHRRRPDQHFSGIL
jgi:hypothetical protein